eukprot:scaffold5705_cov122-Isochrysis_galbana.AAC.1
MTRREEEGNSGTYQERKRAVAAFTRRKEAGEDGIEREAQSNTRRTETSSDRSPLSFSQPSPRGKTEREERLQVSRPPCRGSGCGVRAKQWRGRHAWPSDRWSDSSYAGMGSERSTQSRCAARLCARRRGRALLPMPLSEMGLGLL